MENEKHCTEMRLVSAAPAAFPCAFPRKGGRIEEPSKGNHKKEGDTLYGSLFELPGPCLVLLMVESRPSPQRALFPWSLVRIMRRD